MIKYLSNIKDYVRNRSYTQSQQVAYFTFDRIPLLRYLSFKNVLEIDRFLFIMIFFLNGYWVSADIQCQLYLCY